MKSLDLFKAQLSVFQSKKKKEHFFTYLFLCLVEKHNPK